MNQNLKKVRKYKANHVIGKRFLDLFLALLILMLFSPLFILISILLFHKNRKIIDIDKVYRHNGKTFGYYHFADSPNCDAYSQKLNNLIRYRIIYRLPALINVIKGDMSFVGPSVASIESDVPLYVTYGAKPGLTCLYQIRSAANIAHESMEESEQEYLDNQSFKGDLGILFRNLLMMFLGKKDHFIEAPEKITILDVAFNNLKMSEAVDWIISESESKQGKQIAFINPDCLNISSTNQDYKNLLKKIDRIFADGIGIHFACKMLNVAMVDNVNGTDLFPYLCKAAQKEGKSLFLLGGKPGVVDAMHENIQAQYPKLTIAGTHHGYFNQDDEQNIIDTINQSGAHILLVAFGVPKQELWIARHIPQLNVGVSMGVGGLFDFMSGRISRAPRWMREIGLEWVYRLMQEPKRMWRRYIIGNPLFLWRVWRWKTRH